MGNLFTRQIRKRAQADEEMRRKADGLIIGSPNYLGDVSAGFRALFERLITPGETALSGMSDQEIRALCE